MTLAPAISGVLMTAMVQCAFSCGIPARRVLQMLDRLRQLLTPTISCAPLAMLAARTNKCSRPWCHWQRGVGTCSMSHVSIKPSKHVFVSIFDDKDYEFPACGVALAAAELLNNHHIEAEHRQQYPVLDEKLERTDFLVRLAPTRGTTFLLSCHFPVCQQERTLVVRPAAGLVAAAHNQRSANVSLSAGKKH